MFAAEHPLRRLWNYGEKWRFLAIRGSIYSALNKFFDVAPEVLIGMAVDLVVRKEQSALAGFGVAKVEHQLIFIALLTAFIWICESLFEYLYSLDWRNLAQGIQHELRKNTFDKVLRFPAGWFTKQNTGDLTTIMNDDVNQLERFLDNGINDILQLIVSTLLVLAIFYFISPLIATCALLPIPIIFWGSKFFQAKLAVRYDVVREKASRLSSVISASISGVITIKSYGTETFESNKLGKASGDYQEANQLAIKTSSAFIPLLRVLILMGFVFTLVFGGIKTLDGDISVASYSILVFLTQRLLWPFTSLGQTIDQYHRGMASAKRILDLAESNAAELEQVSGINTPIPWNERISFKDVSFAYGGSPLVIDKLNLEIPRKGFVGIVGATGSGKSSILRLILGLYKPKSGEVTFDGTAISTYPLSQLRASLAYVAQDCFIFTGSILDNVCYGEEPDEARATEVLELVDLQELVQGAKEGIHAGVGENGSKLSGGQVQRLCIARALYRDADILIFDEATSAVDNETEAALQKSISHLAGAKTIISVAHRLSSIRSADIIYVLNDGMIVEKGSHNELVAKGGLYASQWALQTGQV